MLSMLTFVVFVVSSLLIVVQLASAQLTPRIIALVFADRRLKLVLSLYSLRHLHDRSLARSRARHRSRQFVLMYQCRHLPLQWCRLCYEWDDRCVGGSCCCRMCRDHTVIHRPHREPTSRIAWVAVVTALPVIGILAYILFGEVNIGRRRVDRMGKCLRGCRALRRPRQATRRILGLMCPNDTSICSARAIRSAALIP